MQYVTFQENFIQDAVKKVGDMAGAVKNRVQTNIGNAANAVNGAIRSVKGFGQGIVDKANNAANAVTNVANTVGAKGLVGKNQAPTISTQASAIKNSISRGVSNLASTGRSLITQPHAMLNKARSYISG